ncbi:hypothetical protein J6590_008602 [Homalodisca vitripennis]|nr:hypothetical protein J6590_008602 [Homalodisca vitripennis]
MEEYKKNQQKKKEEEEENSRREEAQRIAAVEREFLEKHARERKLSKLDKGGGISATSSQQESDSELDAGKRRMEKRTRRSPNEADNRQSKNRRVEDTEDEDEDEDEEKSELGRDPLENMGKILLKMQNWFKQPQIVKMVKKTYANSFQGYLSELQEQIVRAREDRVILETRVEEKGKSMAELLRTVVREELKVREETCEPKNRATFAQALGRKEVPKISGTKGPVMPAPKLVIVKSENKESEEVKSTLMRLVATRNRPKDVTKATNYNWCWANYPEFHELYPHTATINFHK